MFRACGTCRAALHSHERMLGEPTQQSNAGSDAHNFPSSCFHRAGAERHPSPMHTHSLQPLQLVLPKRGLQWHPHHKHAATQSISVHAPQALREHNVKVVTINPGNVEGTDMARETDKQGALLPATGRQHAWHHTRDAGELQLA